MIRHVIATALTLTLASGVADSNCKRQSNPPVQPAPNPDPAHPNPTKFPGNVSLTFWVTASHPVVIAYNVGEGYKSRSCARSCHWYAKAKPTQAVSVVVTPKDLKQEDWRVVQVIQNNNGRILCEDHNGDRMPTSGVRCSGIVTI